MGRSQQRKGRDAELELVRILAAPGASQSYGAEPDIKGVTGIHVEVKRHERLEIGAWMEQAERDADRFGGWPCVFFRRSREPWRVTMPLTAWIKLYNGWRGVLSDSGGQHDYQAIHTHNRK